MPGFNERYYIPSGIVPVKGLMMMIVSGGGAGIVLSFLYAMLSFYNPFIYVTIIGTLVFGIGTGLAIQESAISGKVRNHIVISITAVVVSVISIYLCWVWYIWALLEYKLLVFSPVDLSNIMSIAAAQGIWEIGDLKPKGWGVYSFWIAEAGVVFYLIMYQSAENDAPFCETCDCWTKEQDIAVTLKRTDMRLLRQTLEYERYEVLDHLNQEEDESGYLIVNLYCCPDCSESNYLTISEVTITEGKSGKSDVKTTTAVKHLQVPQAVVEQLATIEDEQDASSHDNSIPDDLNETE